MQGIYLVEQSPTNCSKKLEFQITERLFFKLRKKSVLFFKPFLTGHLEHIYVYFTLLKHNKYVAKPGRVLKCCNFND